MPDQDRDRSPAAASSAAYSPSDSAADTPEWSVRFDAAPEEREQLASGSTELPRLILLVAGLTVFDAVVLAAYLFLWVVDLGFLLKFMEGRAAFSLALGAAPLVAGSVVLQKNKKSGTRLPGTGWARLGMAVGALLGLVSLAVPIFATLTSMLAPTSP